MSDSASWVQFEMNVSDSPSTIAGGSPQSANSISSRTRSRSSAAAALFSMSSGAPQEQQQSHQPQQNQQHPSLLTQRITNTTSGNMAQLGLGLGLVEQQPTNGIMRTTIQNPYTRPMPALQTTFNPSIGVGENTTNTADLTSDESLNLLSLSIRENTTGGMEVTDQQKICLSISKKYSKNKDRHMKWFLQEIVNNCGDKMAKLASSTVQLPDGSEINAFVHAVQGPRTTARYNILNYALLAFVTKTRLKQRHGHKQKGDLYEPGSMVTMLKSISSHLDCCTQHNTNGACKYSLHKDFRGKGGAISNLQAEWKAEMMKNPQFGRKPFAAIFDHKALEKVENAIKEGKLDPVNNPRHLLLLVIFVQGFKFWLRGCSEQHERQWSDYTFSTHDENIEKLVLSLAEDKTYKPFKIDELIEAHPNLVIFEKGSTNSVLKPISLMKMQKARAAIGQCNYVLFDTCPTTGELSKLQPADINDCLIDLAMICGWDCVSTAHAMRKLGITYAARKAKTMNDRKNLAQHARHSVNSKCTQAIYNNPSAQDQEDFHLALSGIEKQDEIQLLDTKLPSIPINSQNTICSLDQAVDQATVTSREEQLPFENLSINMPPPVPPSIVTSNNMTTGDRFLHNDELFFTNRNLTVDLENSKNEIKVLEKDLRDKEQKVDTLNVENNSLKHTISSLEAKLEIADADLRRAKRHRDEYRDECRELKNDLSDEKSLYHSTD